MKIIVMKLNPAFKRTQPLPLLRADWAKMTGRTAKSIAHALPLTGAWPMVAASAAGRVVNGSLEMPAAV